MTNTETTIYTRLAAVSQWNGFAKSLCEQMERNRPLSDKQVAAVEKMLAKLDANDSARATKSGEVDMTAIEALFATAKASGLKRLAFVADGLRISPAPATGRNAGAFYVKQDEDYQGKIVGGKFVAVASADAETLPKLAEIAADPAGMARLYGKRTGTCCCCGKTLTDPVSIENGIGPVCATRWGL